MNKKRNLIITFVILLFVAAVGSAQAQEKYIDKSGTLIFEASEELFEPVKAVNESVTVILNTATNEIASLALVKSFRFKNSLMEEHFNENYIESETYPKATFKGKLIGFDMNSLTESESEITIVGTLKLHGKEKEINTALMVSRSGEAIHLKGSFTVTPEDFDIDIPNVVKNKIAKEIIVFLDFNLVKK